MKRKFTMSVLIFSMSFLLFNHTHLSAETSSSEELEKVDKTHGIVQLPSLNVYSGSNEEYEVIGELDDYVRVELEGETSNGWYKINDERFSEEAYILGSYIVPVDIPEYEEGYVDGDLVNVREGPNADEAGVAELDQGQQVEIIGEIDDWYKLKLDDVSGPTYVNGSYISSEDPDALDETDQSASEETHTLTEIDYSHGVVQSSSLNVRTGPSSENELIGSLDNYARVEVEGETSDGWYKINGEEFSEEAYVSASAIVPVNEPEYEEGYVKGDIVNVREGPSEDETDVAQLEQGEQVEVVGEINGWYKLKLNDVSGPTYVNGSYINSEDPDALDETEESASEEIQVAETDERTFEETQYLTEPEYSHGVVQSSYLNVRSGPGTDHETIGGLEDYTRVELEGETSDGWYQISGEGFSGEAYVSGDFIVPVDLPEYEEGYVDSDLLNVREGPSVDETRMHQLERNEQVEVVGEIDGWYKLQLDDVEGPTYVSGSYITPEETLELTEPEYSHGIVQSSYLNVRSGPGTDHETIGGLEDYTRVELEGETSDGWYQISGEGFSGEAYVSGDFIVPVDLPEYEEGYVDSDLLNVREGPSVDEERVHQLERNEQVEVVGEIDGWYKLQLDDVDGPTYVSGSYITPEETLELTEPEYSYGIVQSSYLNVRSGPGTDHETIGGLEDYTRVELEGETSDGWYQISGEGFSGEAYVSGDFIVPVDLPEEDVGYVDANISLNVREGPSTSYDQVSSIPRGEEIDLVGEIDGWYKIRMDDVNEPTYVSASLVTNENPGAVGYVDANVSLNVREGPGTSYAQVSSIPRGEQVNIVGETDGWYEIRMDDVSGPTYVSANLVSENPVSEVKIFIDPGHGGNDPGGIGQGLEEKDVALDISLHVAEVLEEDYVGVDVMMSRTTDEFIELPDRAAMANDWGADYFVSVHNNAFNGSASGFESFIFNGNVSSTTIEKQEEVHQYIANELTATDRGMKRENFSVLRNTAMSAILLELLFIDNATDAEMLGSPQGREELGHITADAIAHAWNIEAR